MNLPASNTRYPIPEHTGSRPGQPDPDRRRRGHPRGAGCGRPMPLDERRDLCRGERGRAAAAGCAGRLRPGDPGRCHPDPGRPPGNVYRLGPGDLQASLHSGSTHDLSLPGALDLGRRLGMKLPGDERLDHPRRRGRGRADLWRNLHSRRDEGYPAGRGGRVGRSEGLTVSAGSLLAFCLEHGVYCIQGKAPESAKPARRGTGAAETACDETLAT